MAAAIKLDKGWLAGSAGAFVQLASIRAVRVFARAVEPTLSAGFNVDALVQGNWVTLATMDDERSATDRLNEVLLELKNLFRYG
jgi:hypothetical protein